MQLVGAYFKSNWCGFFQESFADIGLLLIAQNEGALESDKAEEAAIIGKKACSNFCLL